MTPSRIDSGDPREITSNHWKGFRLASPPGFGPLHRSTPTTQARQAARGPVPRHFQPRRAGPPGAGRPFRRDGTAGAGGRTVGRGGEESDVIRSISPPPRRADGIGPPAVVRRDEPEYAADAAASH